MDSCSGDSGGPLFSRAKSGKKSDPLFLTGIVSYGTSLCGIEVHGCQMAIARFSGFWTMAPLRYAAKFDLFLSLDCAPTPSTLAQSKERQGSNFAIWQP